MAANISGNSNNLKDFVTATSTAFSATDRKKN
jgi:hypothetical protein